MREHPFKYQVTSPNQEYAGICFHATRHPLLTGQELDISSLNLVGSCWCNTLRDLQCLTCPNKCFTQLIKEGITRTERTIHMADSDIHDTATTSQWVGNQQ